MRFFSAVMLLCLLRGVSCYGASAVFSADASRIFLAGGDRGLLEASVDSGKTRAIDVTALVGQSVDCLALSNAGYVLCGTPHAVWAYDPEKSKWAKVCSLPANVTIEDLAYRVSDSAVLIVTAGGDKAGPLYMLPKGEETPRSVFCRRVSSLDGAVFRGDKLYFGTRGDLWAGTVAPVDPQPSASDKAAPLAYLEGSRVAPLATLETSLGTPSQMGVSRAAVSGKMVYVHMHRMGGSGWGCIVRMADKGTEPPEAGSGNSVVATAKLYRDWLSSIQPLGENGGESYLCVSRDGQRVFFKADQKYWVVTGNGERQELVFEGKPPFEQ